MYIRPNLPIYNIVSTLLFQFQHILMDGDNAVRNCLNLFSMDFEKIFEMFLQVEKGETFRFRLPRLGEPSAHRPKGDKTAKKILKSLERTLIIKFSKEI